MFFRRKKKDKQKGDSCYGALDTTRELLPEELADDIEQLMNRHGEYEASIDMLIDALTEQDVRINQRQFGALAEALTMLEDLDQEERLFLLEELLDE